MNLKEKKIHKFKTHLPGKSAFTIETSDFFPKLHTLTIASGKRGGGKSVAIANFIKLAKENVYYDRVLLITPTYYSNKAIWDIADIDESDVYEPTHFVLRDVIQFVEAERDEWDHFLRMKELYKKFQHDIRRKPINRIDPETLLMYQDHDFFESPPEWKYRVSDTRWITKGLPSYVFLYVLFILLNRNRQSRIRVHSM